MQEERGVIVKGAIFDLDGTLVDSMGAWEDACLSVLDQNNIEYPEDILNIITPMGLEKTAEYFQSLGVNVPVDLILKKIYDYIVDKYENHITTKEYVEEYLEKLKEQNIKMCILTATDRSLAMPCLERLGIMKYFDFLLSCNDVNLSKTNAEIFLLATDRLGVDIKETTVYDDNVGALMGAKKAGAYTCAVYDKTSEEYKDEIIKFVDRYIVSFGELL